MTLNRDDANVLQFAAMCPDSISLSNIISKEQVKDDVAALYQSNDAVAEILELADGKLIPCINSKKVLNSYIPENIIERLAEKAKDNFVDPADCTFTTDDARIFASPIILRGDKGFLFKAVLKGYFVLCLRSTSGSETSVTRSLCHIIANQYSCHISDVYKRQAERAVDMMRDIHPCSNNERIMKALDSLDVDMILIDRDMRVVWSNGFSIKKYGPSEIESRHCYDVFFNKDHVCDECLVERVFMTREPQPGTFMHKSQTKGTIYVNVTAAPVFDENGCVEYVLEAIHNITSTKRAESELARYKRFINNSNDFMLICNENLSVSAVNLKLTAELGYEQDDLTGLKCNALFSDKDMAKYKGIIEQARNIGIAMGNVNLKRKDGSVISTQAFCTWDNDNKIYETVFHDISERLRMEEEIKKHSEQLMKQNKDMLSVIEERNSFFRNVSHELRTPLTSIIGFTELMLEDTDEPLTGRQRMQMERVAGNGHKLLRFVNELLDLSKIEAHKMGVEMRRVNIKKFLEQIIDNMLPLARNKDLELKLELASDLHDFVTDEQKLGQIMVNLVSNAIKFTQQGSVTVDAYKDENSAYISVRDTGIGMQQDELSVIFKEFYQGTRQSSGQRGTGLGLSIASKLASMLGGKISVESKVGSGSTFTLELPLQNKCEDEIKA